MTALLYGLLALTLLIGGAFALIAPALRRRRIWFVGERANQLTLLLERREFALRELKDLENEHEVGKIESGEYTRLHAAAMTRAREATQTLEHHQSEAKKIRETLEAEVEDRLKVKESRAS